MTDKELEEQVMALADEAVERVESGEYENRAYLAFSAAFLNAYEKTRVDRALARISLAGVVAKFLGDEGGE